LLLAVVYLEQFLPSWLTDSGSNKPGSILDVLIIVAMLGLHIIERSWIYKPVAPTE
jgi:hypothetical protein